MRASPAGGKIAALAASCCCVGTKETKRVAVSWLSDNVGVTATGEGEKHTVQERGPG